MHGPARTHTQTVAKTILLLMKSSHQGSECVCVCVRATCQGSLEAQWVGWKVCMVSNYSLSESSCETLSFMQVI